MVVSVIADTHLPRGNRRLPERCVELIKGSDMLIHAGDIATRRALRDLEAIGPPVSAVHGNVDDAALRRVLPAELEVELAGQLVVVVHDAGPKQGRLERLRLRYPKARAVIFGHTHMPEHLRASRFQIFNPGSPTERRRAPQRSMGLMRIGPRTMEFEHVDLSAGAPEA
jgi:putative phosphoesterase